MNEVVLLLLGAAVAGYAVHIAMTRKTAYAGVQADVMIFLRRFFFPLALGSGLFAAGQSELAFVLLTVAAAYALLFSIKIIRSLRGKNLSQPSR